MRSSPESDSAEPRPPHNPGLRELVHDLRKWSSPPNREDSRKGFQGWHERGYLPHRDEPGLVQFVTYHVVDSFPYALRAEWEQLLKTDDLRKRRNLLEAYLDQGRGSCPLRRPEIARTVEHYFTNLSGKGPDAPYELRAWVVMPNHVHVLFKVGAVPLSTTVASWKKHSARQANLFLGIRAAFWARDYFDVYVRDAEHERRIIRYIENNPARAGLVLDPKHWLWSSARHRDAYGVLRLK